jgi:hypothetical protein
MQLNNPKQQRTLAEIVTSLPDGVRAEAATRIAKVNRLAASRHQQDVDLIDSLRRILESPNPQAERLRQLIKEIVNG